MEGVSKNMQKAVSTNRPTVVFSHRHVEGSLLFMGSKQNSKYAASIVWAEVLLKS
jgi:hypothetical protein